MAYGRKLLLIVSGPAQAGLYPVEDDIQQNEGCRSKQSPYAF